MKAQGAISQQVTAEMVSTLSGPEGKTTVNGWMPKVYVGGVGFFCKNDSYPRGCIEAETEKEAIRLGEEFRDRIQTASQD